MKEADAAIVLVSLQITIATSMRNALVCAHANSKGVSQQIYDVGVRFEPHLRALRVSKAEMAWRRAAWRDSVRQPDNVCAIIFVLDLKRSVVFAALEPNTIHRVMQLAIVHKARRRVCAP